MSFVAGLYGYTFSHPFSAGGLDFQPLYEVFSEAQRCGRDKSAFHLTGILRVPIGSLSEAYRFRAIFFDLEALLTFAEQQQVRLAHLSEVLGREDPVKILQSEDPHDLKEALPSTLDVDQGLSSRQVRPSPGPCLQYDAFDATMRCDFLELAVLKLADPTFLDSTGFRAAFFRNVEMIRLGNAPIDVSYSLLFTGLELLARKRDKTPGKGLAQVLKSMAEGLGFAMSTDEANQIAACRNALFHRGEYEADFQHCATNCMRRVKLTELPDIEALFTDILLRILGFHSQEINWNRWRDRMPF